MGLHGICAHLNEPSHWSKHHFVYQLVYIHLCVHICVCIFMHTYIYIVALKLNLRASKTLRSLPLGHPDSYLEFFFIHRLHSRGSLGTWIGGDNIGRQFRHEHFSRTEQIKHTLLYSARGNETFTVFEVFLQCVSTLHLT